MSTPCPDSNHPIATSSSATLTEGPPSGSSSSTSTTTTTTTPTTVMTLQSPATAPVVTTATVPLSTRLVLSALAGMGAATVCHPLDVVRVRMQTTTTTASRGAWHAARSIVQTAGVVHGLYAGISAAYLRQWMYGSCRMGIYSFLLERRKAVNAAATTGDATEISFGDKLIMGATAGGIGSLIGTPSELALVRMSADGRLPPAQRRDYGNALNCLVRVTREEGVLRLWRGATPTVLRATLLGSFQMGVTSESKGRLAASGWFGQDGQWLGGYPMMLCSTVVASFVANIAANPFDVIKSRMQNMPIQADGTAMYSGMVDCLKQSVQREGIMVLYAGFTPAFLKLAPYTIISLTLADKLTKAVTGKDAL